MFQVKENEKKILKIIMKPKLKKLKKRQRLGNAKSSSDISTVSNNTPCGQSRHVNVNECKNYKPIFNGFLNNQFGGKFERFIRKACLKSVIDQRIKIVLMIKSRNIVNSLKALSFVLGYF